MPGLTRRDFTFLTAAVAASTACGGSKNASSADSVASASQQLVGRWVLVQYQPEEALELSLDHLLRAQIGILTIQFDGQTMKIQGVGLTTERSYQVLEATGNQLRLVIRDADGVTYQVAAAFEASELAFQSQTSPWRGRGRLRRL